MLAGFANTSHAIALLERGGVLLAAPVQVVLLALGLGRARLLLHLQPRALAKRVRVLLARQLEILADVVAKRLKRRDVDDLHAIAEGVSLAALKQRVYCRIERRKSLTAARGRGDKRVAACRNMPPRLALRRRRRAKTTLEPRMTGGVKTREAVGCVWRRLHAE